MLALPIRLQHLPIIALMKCLTPCVLNIEPSLTKPRLRGLTGAAPREARANGIIQHRSPDTYLASTPNRSPSSRGGHSYSTRRTVRDRGQDAVKRSSRIFSTGQAVKRTFWVGQRSRPTFAQTNSYSNSYPTGYTLYTVYLSRLTPQLPAHALVQTGLTFHPFLEPDTVIHHVWPLN